MSRFEPVFLDEDRQLRDAVSQTFLRHYNLCPRSAFLYQQTKGRVQTVEMLRGSVMHTINERSTEHMLAAGEPLMPPEVHATFVEEALAETQLPIEEHDYVRESSYRWAESFTIDPEAVIAIERLVELRIGRWRLRCKIDFAELREDGRLLYVGDYKTGRGAPSYEEISRKRSDGTIAAKIFQLVLYAVALKYGHPINIELCDECHGTGPCSHCNGRGYVEEVEPLPLAAGAQHVIAEFIFPGIKTKLPDGTPAMLRRGTELTALELAKYRESFEAILSNLERSIEEGDWPAIVSDAACDQCPASSLCPIPAELRDHRGEINTMAQLQEASERYYVDDRRLKARRKEIKETAKRLGGPSARVRFGHDRVWEIGDVQLSTEIPDKEGMVQAIREAVEWGKPFDLEDWVKRRESTPFAERKLSEEELEIEAEEQREREAVGA